EIRLMKLHPSQSNEVISCDLIHLSLEEASKLQYHALSYCWDDTNVPTIPGTCHPAILCNEYRKPVTLSLLLALARMRQSGCQYVWADQICINQSDNVEKEHQIALMHGIYTLASVVFVWLGEDTNTKSAARGIAMARKVAKSTEETQILTAPEKFLQMTSEVCAAYGIPDIKELPDYLEMMNLVRRPWFRRSWVVQEIALRPTRAVVHCG
ncbi:HET-domain-containing protein, partial [Lindgomyces ingoldianus]